MNGQHFSSLHLFALTLATGFAMSAQALDLSGRCYLGHRPDESHELQGVTVILYGAPEVGATRTQLDVETSDSRGWYGLTVQEGYEHYFVVAQARSGHSFHSASSVDGTVSGNEIHYSTAGAPMGDQTLTGNKFWYTSNTPPGPENHPPIADADGPYTGPLGSVLILDGSGSVDPDPGDAIVSFEWDLDNNGQYNDATGVNPLWTWNAVGFFTIGLRVTDTFGEIDTDTSSVTIEEGPGPENRPPIADAGGPYAGLASSVITLNGSGSVDPDPGDSIVSYEWDLDNDGQYDDAAGVNLTWTWSTAGVYAIGLRVMDSLGETDTDHATVVINERGAETGTIIIEKRTDPEGALNVFDFIGDIAGSITDGSQLILSNLQSGTYTSQEIIPQGWTLISIQCNDDNSSGDVSTATVTFRLEAGETVIAVFTNKKEGTGTTPDLGPEIDVRGNGISIADGDITPSTADGTDMGSVEIGTGAASTTFLIHNTGSETLTITDALLTPDTYPGAASFGIIPPALSIAPGDSTSIGIECYPHAPGTYVTTLVISSNDADENPYRFGIQGTGIDAVRGEYDFGDAPDSPESPRYATLLANNGARHQIEPDVYLGTKIDLDTNGQPNSGASGDDGDGNDDEDGVVIKTSLIIGSGVTVEVTASTEGYLNAWVDFSQDGNWGQADDHVFIDAPLNAGLNTLTLNVPGDASHGVTYARFRFSRSQGLSYDGEAEDGEVEDYLVEIDDGGGRGKITIIKAAMGSNSFNFTGDLGNFTLTTDSNLYSRSFSNLSPGIYTITENLTGGWIYGGFLTAGDTDDGTTDDSSTASVSIDLDAGEDIMVAVFNLREGEEGASVGDRVWNDLDQDGIQDTGENGIGGVQVSLFDQNGNLLGVATTSSTGYYQYSNLSPGSYFLRFALPSGYAFSPPDQGADETVDSDAQFGTGDTPVFVLSSGDNKSYMDAGMYQSDDGQFDFGDAPDSPESPRYPTLLANNGARHLTDPDIYLGYGVESDPDGQPDSGAQGDDNDGDDDEDGVTLLSPLVQGTAVCVQIIASWPGMLNAWIDFNGNGAWVDADDHVFINQPIGAGPNILSVNVPAGAKPGATFARFRFSTQGGLSYEGEAHDGEVEDYPVEIEVLTSAIGGSVWNDKNNNSGRDAGEPGIAGVTLDLLDLSGSVLFTTVTNSSGRYDFSNLPGGTYMVDVTDAASVLSGFVLTTANDPASVTLAPGQILNVHFGYHQQIATMDFGDAPDPTYPTLLDSDGARHVVVFRTYLGSGVDAELNGKPSPAAQGDDNADTDDEDGISGLPSQLIPGDKPTVTVNASVKGYLNAWIDFSRDGDWSDPGEQIFTNQAINFGLSTLSFSVPTNAESGPTLARFRYNTKGGLSFDGLAEDGEVEDYLVEIGELRLDFGDAPDSYATTLAINGARHPIVTGVYMGAGIDDEIDGQNSTDAQGDDGDGSDDEDGIVFEYRILPGAMSGVKVTASTDGFLYGYIDFDRDGDFAETSDHVFSGSVLHAGVNHWYFIAPSSAVPGPTFARFRFSTEVVMSYDGEAKDGEVEDYTVEIEDPGNMDFGDAPDSYSTLMDSDGARHVHTPGVHLGSGVDHEVNGQPDTAATGDDLHGVNDDDGVTLNSSLTPGYTTYVTVSASKTGYVYAWVDFNGDGDWDDPNEDVLQGTVLFPGPNILSFPVPSTAVLGETFARFRFSTFPHVLSYNKLAHDGEVEDYRVEIGAYKPYIPGCGDANGDGTVDISDAIYIMTYLFVGGPPPVCGLPYCCSDANGDGSLDLQDAIALLRHLYLGIALPPNACCQGPASPVIVPTIEMPAGIVDFVGPAGGEAVLPIMVGDATGLGITAAAMHLTYDPDILTPIGATVEGTVAAGWDVAYETGATGAGGARHDAGEGHIVIALAGSRELGSSGPLVNVIFVVSGEVVEEQASPIRLANISLSSGDPVEIGAYAKFTVGEPHEPPAQPHVKWSQPPLEIDPNPDPDSGPPIFCGWNEPARSTQRAGQRRQWRMVADDFHCLGPIPVTRIRWWGSYLAWDRMEPPELQPEAWHISFWANTVEGLTPDQVYPERMVWALEVPHERIHFEPVGFGEFPQHPFNACYQYELSLEPHEWFHQAEFPANGDIFWISITAIYPPEVGFEHLWGWQTRPKPWRQGAQLPAIMGEWPSPGERLFPGRISPVESAQLCSTNQTYDLCFELLTEQPWGMWDQPFTNLRDWAHYEDHASFAIENEDGNVQVKRRVADDWLCERANPIVAVSWHGSYIGYGYQACTCEQMAEPRRPDYFMLSLRTLVDHPANGAISSELVWEYRAYDYDEVLVGYDRNPTGDPVESVFSYSVRLPEDAWFREGRVDQVYWLSVVAVYRTRLDEIEHPWGWTNRQHTFGSTAHGVSFADDGPVRTPLHDQSGNPVDMSFRLLTIPGHPLAVGQVTHSKSSQGGGHFEPGAMVAESPTGAAQINPDIAVDGQGIIHAVWEDYGADPALGNIMYANSSDGGRSFGERVMVDDAVTASTHQARPHIALGSDGVVHVVWEDYRRHPELGDIYYSRSTDGGRTFGADVLVDDPITVTSRQINPALAVDSRGHIHIVWEDYRDNIELANIYYAMSSDRGQTFSGDKRISEVFDHAVHQGRPIIVTHGRDTVYVVWEDYRNTPPLGDIYCAVSDDGGETFGDNLTVDDPITVSSRQIRPAAAVDDTGIVHVVWEDYRDDPERGNIYSARSIDGGRTFQQDVMVDAAITTSTHQANPALATAGDGRVQVVWEDYRDFSDHANIYTSTSTDRGKTFGEDLIVDGPTPTSGPRTNPAIAVDERGVVHLVWQERTELRRDR